MESASGSGWQMATGELMRAVVEQAAVVRREYARQLGMVAELVNRGAAVEFGYGSPERMLVDLLRVGRGEARRTVSRAVALHDTVRVGGAVCPVALPATAAAVAEGAVSVEHVDRIIAFNDALPVGVDEEARSAAERALADIARTSPPHGLTRPINELTARLDPDGAEPSEAELRSPHRELRTVWQGDRFRFAGEVDRETGMLLDAVLSPLAAPRPAVEGDVDMRSVAERYGDAFATLVDTAARASDTVAGDSPVTILLTMDAEHLRERVGVASTMDGASIPNAQLRRIACDAGVIPALLGKSGEVLDLGSRARTAPSSVRNRLVLRDKGCAFPGCDRLPSQTHAHHIQHWVDGGLTVPENMVLLCHHHHRLIHYSPWEVHIGRHGLPEFTPPAYLDPARIPRYRHVA